MAKRAWNHQLALQNTSLAVLEFTRRGHPEVEQPAASRCLGAVTAKLNVPMLRMKKIVQNAVRTNSDARQASASPRNKNAMAFRSVWTDQMNKDVVQLGSFTVQNFAYLIYSFVTVRRIVRTSPTNLLLLARTVWPTH